MISTVLEKWHHYAKQPNPEILQDILSEDVTFHSPVIHTPQKGKMLTSMYLLAAAQTFTGKNKDFKYTREVMDDRHIILEFMVNIDGICL